MSMRFCMVSTFYPPYNFGGDGMHIYRLSNELAKRGHTVDVFHCEDSYLLLDRKRPTGNFPNHENVRVHGLKSPVGPFSPLATQQTGKPLFKNSLKVALENGHYDVIHYHNMSLIGIDVLSYGSGVKLYTTHEHWLVCPMHVLWKFNREVCTKPSCTLCQLAGKRPPQLWRLGNRMERMLEHVDCFLSPSRFTLRKHKEMGLDIPIRHLPYFLPKPDHDLDSMELAYDSPYFLFVGRLEYIKGVHELIETFRANRNFNLLIAGEGSFRKQLEQQAYGLDNIKFLGRLGQKELAAYYRCAQAVIVPSICYETFGIIIIEAFSYGTPVIANDLGALPEVIEDSNGGFTYRTESELVDAMHKLSSDREIRDRLGENGRVAYMRYWNEKAHLEEYLGIIDSIMARNKCHADVVKPNTVEKAV